jgi:hypothetical protein
MKVLYSVVRDNIESEDVVAVFERQEDAEAWAEAMGCSVDCVDLYTADDPKPYQVSTWTGEVELYYETGKIFQAGVREDLRWGIDPPEYDGPLPKERLIRRTHAETFRVRTETEAECRALLCKQMEHWRGVQFVSFWRGEVYLRPQGTHTARVQQMILPSDHPDVQSSLPYEGVRKTSYPVGLLVIHLTETEEECRTLVERHISWWNNLTPEEKERQE